MLIFTAKFSYNLNLTNERYPFNCLPQSVILLRGCLNNLSKFKPMKKVPVYDQHLIKEDPDPNALKMMIATICFGMGVNKKDIRYVINVGISSSV